MIKKEKHFVSQDITLIVMRKDKRVYTYTLIGDIADVNVNLQLGAIYKMGTEYLNNPNIRSISKTVETYNDKASTYM